MMKIQSTIQAISLTLLAAGCWLPASLSGQEGGAAAPAGRGGEKTAAAEAKPVSDEEAGKWVDAFLKAPAVPGPQLDITIAGLDGTLGSEKAKCAIKVISARNAAAFARMWKLYPDLTADEQGIFALFIQGADHLDQVPAMIAALPKTKSEAARTTLSISTSAVISAALQIPERADEAAKQGEELKAAGFAQQPLVKRLEARKAAKK
ncbi:MAG: hypothetical protein JWO82_1776 [Akkermansiaceae bacterium]|nr:hypothetical protein [Akkermansiaceae bacterium]